MLGPRWRTRAARVHSQIRTTRDVLLFIRMLSWSAALRLLKHIVPLPILVRLMHAGWRHRQFPHAEEQVTTLARWAGRLTQWSPAGNCLERGLVTYRYLALLDANPSLVVGVRVDDAPGPRGHAWVQAGARLVGEPPEAIAPFTRVLAFDAGGAVAPARDTVR